MNKMLTWFLFGFFFSLSLVMILFGILFIRDTYLHGGEMAFGSLILGILLFITGGGLFSSTVGGAIRKFYKK